MYLVLCRKIHSVTDHHKGTAVTAYGYDQEHYVTFSEGTKIVEDQTGKYFLMNENPFNTMEKTHSNVVFKETERRFDSQRR